MEANEEEEVELLRMLTLVSEPNGFPWYVEDESEYEDVDGVLTVFGERFTKRRCRAANGRELLVEVGGGKADGERVIWLAENEVRKQAADVVDCFDEGKKRQVKQRKAKRPRSRLLGSSNVCNSESSSAAEEADEAFVEELGRFLNSRAAEVRSVETRMPQRLIQVLGNPGSRLQRRLRTYGLKSAEDPSFSLRAEDGPNPKDQVMESMRVSPANNTITHYESPSRPRGPAENKGMSSLSPALVARQDTASRSRASSKRSAKRSGGKKNRKSGTKTREEFTQWTPLAFESNSLDDEGDREPRNQRNVLPSECGPREAGRLSLAQVITGERPSALKMDDAQNQVAEGDHSYTASPEQSTLTEHRSREKTKTIANLSRTTDFDLARDCLNLEMVRDDSEPAQETARTGSLSTGSATHHERERTGESVVTSQLLQGSQWQSQTTAGKATSTPVKASTDAFGIADMTTTDRFTQHAIRFPARKRSSECEPFDSAICLTCRRAPVNRPASQMRKVCWTSRDCGLCNACYFSVQESSGGVDDAASRVSAVASGQPRSM